MSFASREGIAFSSPTVSEIVHDDDDEDVCVVDHNILCLVDWEVHSNFHFHRHLFFFGVDLISSLFHNMRFIFQ
jgi:hypothetical protein